MEIMKWVKNPSRENSKMPGALKKFGIMPYQSFPEDTIMQISKEVNKIIKHYEIDIKKWIKSLENGINSHISQIQKVGTDSLKALENNKAQKVKASSEAKMVKRDIDKIKQNIDTLAEKITLYKVMEKRIFIPDRFNIKEIVINKF